MLSYLLGKELRDRLKLCPMTTAVTASIDKVTTWSSVGATGYVEHRLILEMGATSN